MANLPWEPCPRCSEKQVEVISNADRVGGTVATVVLVGVGMFIILKFFNALGGSLFAVIVGSLVLLLLARLFRWILGPIFVALFSFVGILAGHGVKGYHAKCKTCSYEWEITEERAKELQAQTPAR